MRKIKPERKIKLDVFTLIWLAILADDVRWESESQLIEKLEDARDRAEVSLFSKASISLSESEIVRLKKLLKWAIREWSTSHGRWNSERALNRLEKATR